jgi:hypothetical protein
MGGAPGFFSAKCNLRAIDAGNSQKITETNREVKKLLKNVLDK